MRRRDCLRTLQISIEITFFADQPDIINDIIGKSTVNRKKGIHMTKEIIKFSEILIKDWLNQEYAPGP